MQNLNKNITINIPHYNQITEKNKLYEKITSAFQYIHENWETQPSLTELANHCNYSEEHMQRLFKQWMGISPKKLLKYLTLSAAQQYLHNGNSILNTTYDVGLSSTSRLHDLFISLQAMTPNEYKTHGKNITIEYGWHETPFGQALLMMTEKGICGFAFVDKSGKQACFNDMANRWKYSQKIENIQRTKEAINTLFSGGNTNLILKGTNFQLQVWEALLKIPTGHWRNYENISDSPDFISEGKGQAIGGALGANPISMIIPCHRVIAKSGILNGYHWGLERKTAMLAAEGAALGVLD